MAFNKNWSLHTNGTFQEAVLVRSGEASSQIKGVPERFLRAWAEYRLFLKELDNPITFNLGYRYTSDRTVNSSAFGLPVSYLPDYSVWDAGVSFMYQKWNIRWQYQQFVQYRVFFKSTFSGGTARSFH